ncbi:hypothetical protein [Flexithrix dorotheae]|uniref:hypothetical protein n=1 Tax=Flexithrix dorotheae TaxID=70993 RepID=UPI0012F77759|nr:hypothetical protein [Flexithrix dorotheae]
MEIYKSQFIEIQFFKKDSIIRNSWSPNTCIMQEGEFKSELLKIVESISQFKPKYLLSIATELFFNMSPNLQEWAKENFIDKAFNLGITKIGVVLSPETFDKNNIQEQIDQTFDLPLHYFSNEKEARVWLEKF